MVTGLVQHRPDKLADLLPQDDDACAGLPANVLLAEGARVMLRRNVDTRDGLVNGARGVVRGFEWEGEHIEGVMPSKVYIKFDGRAGRGNSEEYRGEQVVALRPVTADFYGKKGTVIQRRQLPLILSYAVTVHKVQGLSLDRVVIDVGGSVFDSGMTYVALSRLTSLGGLYLQAFDPSNITVSQEVNIEMHCLRE